MKKRLMLFSLLSLALSICADSKVVKIDEPVEIPALVNMVGPHKNFFALLIAYYQTHGKFPCRNRVILDGPPGTGKTMYPEEIAKLLGCNYIKIRSSSVINTYMGSGPNNLKKAFSFIKDMNIDEKCDVLESEGFNPDRPTIVCIDEADLMLAISQSQTSDEARRCCGELLSILDKIKNNPNVYVFITTNYYDRIPEQIRSRIGGNCIKTGFPNEAKRKFLIERSLSGYSFTDKDIKNFVAKSKDMSDRAIVYACEEAIELVGIAGRQINKEQIEYALDRAKEAEKKIISEYSVASSVVQSQSVQIAMGNLLVKGVEFLLGKK